MPNRVRVLTVPDDDRAELLRRSKDRGAPARVTERARIVLLAADGLTGPQIAERTGCTEPTVIKWRRQYAGSGAGRAGGRAARRRPGNGADRGRGLRDPGSDTDPAAGIPEEGRGHALVGAAAGGLAAAQPQAGGQPPCGAAAGWRSATIRWPGSGGVTACSRTGPRASSSPPTRSSARKSATSWACT